MSATTPTVSAHWVYDPAQPAAAIRLDTPAWVAWLDAVTTTRFAYPVYDPAHGYIAGLMTVRKEQRQRGGAYWVAYRRCQGRLCKVYLGRAATLTQARLDTTAHTFGLANAGTDAYGLAHARRKMTVC